MWLYRRVKSPNDADRMANSVDPYQTAPLQKCIDSGYHVSTTPYTTSCLSLFNFAHLFGHGLKMCMWFGFNPAVNFCHFSSLFTLSFFAGVTQLHQSLIYIYIIFCHFFPLCELESFFDLKCIDRGYLVSATPLTILYRSF